MCKSEANPGDVFGKALPVYLQTLDLGSMFVACIQLVPYQTCHWDSPLVQVLAGIFKHSFQFPHCDSVEAVCFRSGLWDACLFSWILASVWDWCPPCMVRKLGSYNWQWILVKKTGQGTWCAGHKSPLRWFDDDSPPCPRTCVNVGPAAGQQTFDFHGLSRHRVLFNLVNFVITIIN